MQSVFSMQRCSLCPAVGVCVPVCLNTCMPVPLQLAKLFSECLAEIASHSFLPVVAHPELCWQ